MACPFDGSVAVAASELDVGELTDDLRIMPCGPVVALRKKPPRPPPKGPAAACLAKGPAVAACARAVLPWHVVPPEDEREREAPWDGGRLVGCGVAGAAAADDGTAEAASRLRPAEDTSPSALGGPMVSSSREPCRPDRA